MTDAALTALQTALDAAISASDTSESALALFRTAGRRSPAQQLRAMRATAIGARLTVLREIHPVFEALVGAEFFERAAGPYCRRTPGDAIDLTMYGAGFADWLDTLSLDATPWAADLVRLEWALHRAARAPVVSGIGLDALARIAPEQRDQARFVLDSGSTLIVSPYAVVGLWHAHQQAQLDDFDVARACHAIVRPGHAEPVTIELTTHQAEAWQAFAQEPNLDAVCQRLLRQAIDPVVALVEGVQAGWFSAVQCSSIA